MLALAAQAQAAEVIKAFDVDIAINRQGGLIVDEVITLVAEGNRIKHGIYLDFDLSRAGTGANRPASFSVLKVERDGAKEDFHSGFLASGTRIYIGSADRLLTPGLHSYQFAYKTDGRIIPAGTDDLFAWVAIGQWNFPIEHASATLHLPHSVTIIGAEGFAGSPDAADSNVGLVKTGDSIRFASVAALKPNERLLFKVKIPRGAIAPANP